MNNYVLENESVKDQMLEEAIEHWVHVAPLIVYPKNDKDFDKLVSRLDILLNIVGNNEKHKLMELVDIISNIVLSYEKAHYQKPAGRGVDALKFLMDSHCLHQSDLNMILQQTVCPAEILMRMHSIFHCALWHSIYLH